MPGLEVAVLAMAESADRPLVLGAAVPWLSGRGHLNPLIQAETPPEVLSALASIHIRLGGDATLLAAKKLGRSPTPDLVHTPTGSVVEIDEVAHFTTSRLLSLDLYPAGIRLGFDLDEYRALIGEMATPRREGIRTQGRR